MTAPPAADLAAGMGFYATEGPPCAARIKERPDDFRVEEALAAQELLSEAAPGLLPLYRVEKRGVDTLHLEAEVSAALKSRVSFAGLKDKRSVSVQHFTPTSSRASSPPYIEGEGFRAERIGFVRAPLARRMVSGNRFAVRLRGCCPEVGDRVAAAFESAAAGLLPNFYGLQRFGGSGALTWRVGRAIVKGDLEGAVGIILLEPRERDGAGAAEARELMASGDFARGLQLLPRGQDVERLVASRLARRPGDWAGSLRAVPIRLRRLYAQAYQSYLFNRTLTIAAGRGLDLSSCEPGDNWGVTSPDGLRLEEVHGVREPRSPGAVPLVQFAGYAFRDFGSRFDSCLKEAMDSEGVAPREFYVEALQEVSVEGGFRRPHMTVRDPRASFEGDSATMEFTLPRGEYATVLVREVVKPGDPGAQGFA